MFLFPVRLESRLSRCMTACITWSRVRLTQDHNGNIREWHCGLLRFAYEAGVLDIALFLCVVVACRTMFWQKEACSGTT